MTRKKILVVDDSTTTLMMQKVVLSRLPCDVVTARDGREAVDIAVSEQPDLIVMDVEMPRLNGFDACRELRARLGRVVPIVLLTTRSDTNSVRKGYESGATGYLMKPVAPADLLGRVRHYLGLAS